MITHKKSSQKLNSHESSDLKSGSCSKIKEKQGSETSKMVEEFDIFKTSQEHKRQEEDPFSLDGLNDELFELKNGEGKLEETTREDTRRMRGSNYDGRGF